ncbi:S41 family peptidase [Stenotrophomonas sp.]|uniref:S41 family peptidase n=1 Tax=Stenotrophomonas sp. TaxID=69392 RepID=UPI002FCB2AA7
MQEGKTGVSRRWMAMLIWLIAAPGVASDRAIDHAAWDADFLALKQALEADYAHLAWAASAQSGVDVPALERAAQWQLAQAVNDDQAEQALRQFLAGFHDGHLTLQPRQVAGVGLPAPPASVDPGALDAATGCAVIGVVDEGRQDFSVPLQTLPGYRPLSVGAEPSVRAGLIPLPDGRTIGLLRLHEFDALRYPGLCHRLWPQLRHAGTPDDMRGILQSAWVAEIAASLRRMQQQGAAAVLVDVGTNPGGDDSGDSLARLFSDRRVQSAPLWVSQSAAGRDYLLEQLERLQDTQRRRAGNARIRRTLQGPLAQFHASLQAIGHDPCDLSWAWQSQRDWQADRCRRLVPAGSSGGPLATAEVDALNDFLVAHRLDWAQDIRAHWGAWHGPVYVLVDGKTFSSAEMFAARMQDNRLARVVGSHSGGDGCGFMTSPAPRVLPHSGLRVRIPNCVRLRADGSDEVAGIAPDLPLEMQAGENARARAQRLLGTLGQDIDRP